MRTYRLRVNKDGNAWVYAWIYDDTGEIYEGMTFETLKDSKEWLAKRHGLLQDSQVEFRVKAHKT